MLTHIHVPPARLVPAPQYAGCYRLRAVHLWVCGGPRPQQGATGSSAPSCPTCLPCPSTGVGFFVHTLDATEPYSALYVHLVVQIISGWMHVKNMMPSAQQLRKPAVVQDYCEKLLLRMSYEGAYDRKQGMSVMLSFNDALWEHEAYRSYHEAQRLSNPHWRPKKEVYSSFQPGHVCTHCTSDFARCHTRNEECGVNCDGRFSCCRRRYWLAQTCAFAVLVPLVSAEKLPNPRPVVQHVSVRWQRSWHGWTTELSFTASIGRHSRRSSSLTLSKGRRTQATWPRMNQTRLGPLDAVGRARARVKKLPATR